MINKNILTLLHFLHLLFEGSNPSVMLYNYLYINFLYIL